MGAYVNVTANWLRMQFNKFAKEEVGGGEIIATVVVIAIVIMLGVIFQKNIVEFFGTLWNQATGGASGIGGSGAASSGGTTS